MRLCVPWSRALQPRRRLIPQATTATKATTTSDAPTRRRSGARCSKLANLGSQTPRIRVFQVRVQQQQLGDQAVHLEHLGVFAVHVDAVGTRDVPDVLGVRVAAVLLRGVLLEGGDLALHVTGL